MGDDSSGTASRLSLGEGARRWFLRPPRRHGEAVTDRTVSFLELFYDLVFVVLIAQAAHTLAEHVSWAGVADFAVVFGLIWIAWMNGSQYHEIHGSEDGRSRSLIFAQMLLLAVLGVYVGHATDEDGRQFAIVYVLLLLLLTWQWYSVHRIDSAQYRRTTSRYLAGMGLSVVVMLASVPMPEEARVVAWAALVLGWLLGGAVFFRRLPEDARGVTVTDSMVERYGLFVIIVLGEVVVGVVDGLSEVDRDLTTVATGVLALVIGFGFWWNYFDLAGRRLPRDSSAALAAWLFAHLPLTAAVAAAGAGMVSLVEHADDARTPAATAWLISGSVTVMLLSLVAVVRTLEDAGRLAALYRPMPAVLASAAAVALLLGWARPAPWLLALSLDLVLTATWWVAFAGWVRSGMRPRADVE